MSPPAQVHGRANVVNMSASVGHFMYCWPKKLFSTSKHVSWQPLQHSVA